MDGDIVEVEKLFRGLVIGTGGGTVKRIEEESGAEIRQHPDGFRVRGSDHSRQSAKEQILRIVERKQVSWTRAPQAASDLFLCMYVLQKYRQRANESLTVAFCFLS